ncbi:MAG TPA: beta-propeller fold lactonase family protein [Labilithrix sp.]|nr:beta-propeller fold lactonase family protein [Labilithrix sp.]
MRSLRILPAVAALALGTALSAPADAQPPRLEVQAVAATGSMPKGVSLSPDTKRAYVTNFGQSNGHNIEIVDAQSLTHLDTIDLPGNVVESVLSPDGTTIFASNFIRNSVQFIDVKTKRVAKEIPTGTHPKILVLSPDGRSLFAANWSGDSVTQIDVASAKVVRTLPAGKNPRGMVMTKGGTLYVANFNGESIDVFKGGDFSERHRFAACPIPRHLTLTTDEKLLLVSCYHDSMLHAVDVGTEKVVHQLHVGSSPKTIEVSRDGRWIWSADYGKETNSVTVVDTDDWTARVFAVPGMDHGSGLTIYPDGKHALVTGWYDNHVYLVGFEGTGGDPTRAVRARAQIDGWIRRPKHD